MKKVVALLSSTFLLLMFCAAISYSGITQRQTGEPAEPAVEKHYANLPLAFIENVGQTDEKVAYYLKGKQGTIYFTREGITYDLISVATSPSKGTDFQKIEKGLAKTSRLSFTIKPEGARKGVKLTGTEAFPGRVNCLTGKDPRSWRTSIPAYRSILYEDLYRNIDLKVYGTSSQMEYDFIVHPGADPNDIRLACQGTEGLELDNDGNLVVKTRFGELKHLKPAIYQEIDGKRCSVAGSFRVAKNTFAFDVKEYDTNYPLIIDPLTLAYSTYLGGSSTDGGYGIAVDGSGNAYVTGATFSSNFPVQNAYQESVAGSNDVFVTKLSADGSSLVYSTYLGGSDNEYGYGIAVDGSGSAYVTGLTYSDDFPVQNPFQGNFAGTRDGFVSKLSPDGRSLTYSTYLGGDAYEIGYGIAVDSTGSAYVTGETDSSNFPVQNPFQERNPNFPTDAFVTKLSPNGRLLSYSTYLGGDSYDVGYGIAVDGSGNAYVTGETSSNNFPVQNPFQRNRVQYYDVFVTKLHYDAASQALSLAYSTYLGGSDYDGGYGIAVDAGGNAYVTGQAESEDFPVWNPFQQNHGGGGTVGHHGDAFITKVNSDGSSLAYSSYLGGSGDDWANGVAVDASGDAHVTGRAGSTDFPVKDAWQQENGGGAWDMFVTKVHYDAVTHITSLAYSTYLGGSDIDEGQGIAVDSSGNAYAVGHIGGDAFIAKLRSRRELPLNPTGTTTTITGIPQVNTPITLTVTAAGTGTFYYRFFVGTNYGAPWTQIQPWSTNSSCTYTPTSESNNVFLAHMSVDPNSGSFHQAGFSFATSGHSQAGVVIYGLTSTIGMPQTAGTPISLSVQAYGSGTIYYKFWYKDDTGWHVIQNWSQSNAANWTPPRAGTYTIAVWANTTPDNSIPNRPIAGLTCTVEE